MSNTRDDHREAVCPICNKTVAPYAPERMPLGKDVLHKSCWDGCSLWKQAQIAAATGADPEAAIT